MKITPMFLEQDGADDLEKLLRLRAAQGGGRLVEDEEPALLRQGAGNQHHLLLREGETADRRARVQRDVELPEDPAGLLVQRPPPHHLPRPHVVHHEVEHDVLTDAQGGNQRRVHLLVDHLDAEALGLPRGADTHLPAVDEDPACVMRVGAGKHLHEGGFAGAVRAHQGMGNARFGRNVTLRSALTPGKLMEMSCISRVERRAPSRRGIPIPLFLLPVLRSQRVHPGLVEVLGLAPARDDLCQGDHVDRGRSSSSDRSA